LKQALKNLILLTTLVTTRKPGETNLISLLSLMLRSGNAISFISQWIFDNNLRLGFAMDLTYNEIFPYHYGTYEVTLGFDMDFFCRSYIREK